MSLLSADLVIQMLIWAVGVIAVILACYILVLNVHHPANRHVSLLVGALALGNIAMALLSGADSLEQALLATKLYAGVAPMILPACVLAAVALLRPGWLRGRYRWLWWGVYLALIVPIVLTVVDSTLGTQIWYRGIEARTYGGGFLPLDAYVSPKLYGLFVAGYGITLGLLPLLPALSVLGDKRSSRFSRRMAHILVGLVVLIAILQIAFRSLLGPLLLMTVTTLGYGVVYVYIFFRQMVVERRIPRGPLANRLAALFLAITFPILLIGVLLVSGQARLLLRRSAVERLETVAGLVVSVVNEKVAPSPQDLQRLVRSAAVQVGDTGVVYIVDRADRIVAHSLFDFSLLREDDPLRNAAQLPPVKAMRQGTIDELFIFTDEKGIRWWSYPAEVGYRLYNVVVQQQESVIMAKMQRFLILVWVLVATGTPALLVLGYLGVRYAFAPITSLTETARAIEAGDLTRVAAIESEDEIGMLAQAFNSVTARLNNLIGNLEQQVAERTREVERRAAYLAVTGSVGQAITSILDVEVLLDRVVHLISERFGFYHAGIFLLDETREWAVLRAVSSEGGARMLARGHRLRVGGQGIVGYVADTGRARIALDVDKDIVWVSNPDLPETRSEMALPLMVGQEVIGVLDVQSREAEAFRREDIATLRILADQIAVAIRNAQSFEESRRALSELQRMYGEEIRAGWAARSLPIVGYRYTSAGLTPLASDAVLPPPETSRPSVTDDNTLIVPLQLAGGVTFGALRLSRDVAAPWGVQDIHFVERAAQDIA